MWGPPGGRLGRSEAVSRARRGFEGLYRLSSSTEQAARLLTASLTSSVCATALQEIPSSRLRPKTVVIARIAYNAMSIVTGIIMPYMLNTDELNWGAKMGFFWAGLCGICALYTYFRVPEPRGRTYGELDVLFHNRISARKFASTTVDQFAQSNAAHGGGDKADKGEKERIERAV
ncbi:hypothetical protein JCM9279_000966 [Rhodotorula babjevae]